MIVDVFLKRFLQHRSVAQDSQVTFQQEVGISNLVNPMALLCWLEFNFDERMGELNELGFNFSYLC